MIDLNRRNVFGVAGAVAMLSACDKKTALTNTGISPLHGWSTIEEKPDPLHTGIGFNPGWLCLVYLKWTGTSDDLGLVIRHVYVKASNGADEPKSRAQAEEAFVIIKGISDADWLTPDSRFKRKEVGFTKFGFDSQQRIYMFIDNDNVQFNDKFNFKNLVRFSKLGPNEQSEPTSYTREPNNSFFSVFTKEASTVDLKKRKLLHIANWNVDENGKEIKKSNPKTYSMNVHLVMKSGSGVSAIEIPMILDPDTGNGSGWTP